MTGRLEGKVAIITGAARGIGRACATAFAAQGADLVLLDVCGDVDGVPYPLGTRGQLDHTAKTCEAAGASVITTACDVRDPAAARQAVEAAAGRYGRIDVLVNNAGIAAPSGKVVHEITDTEWDVMLGVDLTGAFHLTRAVAPVMIGQRAGSIVNIASTAGLVGYRNFAGYVTAKHGLIGLTKATALDYAPFRVRANALCPGSVRDDPHLEGRMLVEIARSLAVDTTDHEAVFAEQQPTNHLVEAQDVAATAVWLASDESPHVTGSVITVDGAFTAR
ncbi:putative short chain dehydrogenase/reductase [Lentzea sp. NBRC 105346]|uniref:SDR family oxidoreductase n=1 Tax=Lentzea sp. NBRC 105346 TaxID=3032205 RepID=UPI0024A104F8|nr:SDR family oxidoreductase [Lentzea sp. NBRC 105346]GLZ28525.1 putative short chain dehydrogenase/reductase [Lentzea sp. NBRC 105346]